MQNQRDYAVLRRQLGEDGRWWSARVGIYDTMSAGRIQGLFHRGNFSLLINRMNFRKPAVAALAEELSAWFGHRVNANMYLTPAVADRRVLGSNPVFPAASHSKKGKVPSESAFNGEWFLEFEDSLRFACSDVWNEPLSVAVCSDEKPVLCVGAQFVQSKHTVRV